MLVLDQVPVSLQRLSVDEDGRVCIRFKQPWRSGRTGVRLRPEVFVLRLASLLLPAFVALCCLSSHMSRNAPDLFCIATLSARNTFLAATRGTSVRRNPCAGTTSEVPRPPPLLPWVLMYKIMKRCACGAPRSPADQRRRSVLALDCLDLLGPGHRRHKGGSDHPITKGHPSFRGSGVWCLVPLAQSSTRARDSIFT
ncbi:MAG: hypothetical protein ACI8PZ_006800 [Myxococcota bacterium]|jgi:hypothetical protein